MTTSDVEKIYNKLVEWEAIEKNESVLEDLLGEFVIRGKDSTLATARLTVIENADAGTTCPVCDQFVKIYRFGINSAISRGLIQMYRTGGRDWVDVPGLGLPGGHLLKFRFWSIIEKPPELVRADGSTRVGIWRITELGEQWVLGKTSVKSHARIFNNNCLGLVGDQIKIKDALGNHFNYRELMEGI